MRRRQSMLAGGRRRPPPCEAAETERHASAGERGRRSAAKLGARGARESFGRPRARTLIFFVPARPMRSCVICSTSISSVMVTQVSRSTAAVSFATASNICVR